MLKGNHGMQPPRSTTNITFNNSAADTLNSNISSIPQGQPTQNNPSNGINANTQNGTKPTNVFTSEFEINDYSISARNTLTKGQTQDEITRFSGASITTRGRYLTPEEKRRTGPAGQHQSRALYLFIQGNTQQSVALAIQKINEIIAKDPGNLHNRMAKFNTRPPPIIAQQHQNANQPQQPQTVVEKILIGLDHAPAAFNLRDQVIGAGGANLNYIRNETGAIATLRGRGSLFSEPHLGTESQEQMHLYIEHHRFDGLQKAKQLVKNLIETLQQELTQFRQIHQQTSQQNSQPHPQINVPPPMLAVPPPTVVQQAPVENSQQQTIVQQNFIQQQPPPSLGGPPQTVQSQPHTIIHQQVIPQTVPIQFQQANMVLQQPPPPLGNLNIPPPGISIPIKGPILQFQGPPPPHGTQITQPPPNVQIQHQAPPATAQFVLNPPPNYQYQYIQQPVQTSNEPQNQLTIQHIYQPQPHIQGIIHQPPPNTQGLDQISRPIQTTQPPQYITVQGSTAYMVPPPTIIHQTTSQPNPQSVQTHITTSNPSIIFQPPPQLQQVQVQVAAAPGISIQNAPPPPPPQIVPAPTVLTNTASNMLTQENSIQTSDATSDEIKEEGKLTRNSDERKSPDEKNDIKTESESIEGSEINLPQSNATSVSTSSIIPTSSQSIQLRHPPPTHIGLQAAQQQQQQQVTTITQVPPPTMMAVPPPTVQHFVGNTLVTTQPAHQLQNQIYNQVPVSIQQITQPGQQIHVSTPSGHHFLVNTAPQWQTGPPPTMTNPPPTLQQIQTPNGTIQNVHITQHQIAPPDFRTMPPPGVPTVSASVSHQPHQAGGQSHLMTFNPQQLQVQFQPPQILQQIHPTSQIIDPNAHMINSQITVHPGVGTQQPPTFSVVQTQTPMNVAPVYQQAVMQQPPPILQAPPPPPTHQQFQQHMQIKSNIQQYRLGQKRKHDNDDSGPNVHQPPPRMGMGPRDIQQQMNPKTDQTPPGNGNSGGNNLNGPSSNTTNNAQDENSAGQTPKIDGPQQQQQQQLTNIVQQLQRPPPPPPPAGYYHDSRPFYQRVEGPHPSQGAPPMIHGPRGPRFHQNGQLHGVGGGGGGTGTGPGFGPMMRPHMHMQQPDGNFPMHRTNMGPPPQTQTSYSQFRMEGPPNMSNISYCPPGGPPGARFRGAQW